jgi:hypothetical protein
VEHFFFTIGAGMLLVSVAALAFSAVANYWPVHSGTLSATGAGGQVGRWAGVETSTPFG